jgi:hypothetical protein
MILRIIKQVLGVLVTGYILFYYSELVFWARIKPTDSLPEWTSTWLAYSLLAFVFLTIVARLQVHTIWALFLAGAVFGWMTEGIIVQTAYEDLPLSLSFTGLAWHALISVWVGWYAVRRALYSGLRSTIFVAAAIGFVYGLWAISWWVEPGEVPAPPLEFAQYTFVSTFLLIFAHWLYDRTVPAYFVPNRIVEIIAAILFLLYFAFVAVPAAPLAVVILPVLLLLIYLALRRNRQRETRPPLHTCFVRTDQIWRYLVLLLIPVAASIVYAAAYYAGVRWYTNWILYLISTPAGFILFVISYFKVWRMKAVESTGVPSANEYHT